MAVGIGSGRLREALIALNQAVALDLDLDGTDMRVFLYLTGRLNSTLPVVIAQLEVATAIGKRKEHVSRSMRKLEAKGILVAGERVGKVKSWRFNPDYEAQA